MSCWTTGLQYGELFCAQYQLHRLFRIYREGTELKQLIKALHDNGMNVILDVVFNHTAEGNEYGPSFCFKGFDNNIYYMLTPEAIITTSAAAAIP